MNETFRVLVVDDERAIRQFLRISLSSQGFAVSEAATGAQAIETVLASSGEPIDLVLLDLGLPDMEGQAVLAAIRRASNVPVIIVSVRGHEAEKVQALDAGANDYVTKPFGIEELLARVRALLRRPALVGHARPYCYGELRIEPAARRVTLAGRPVRLTPKEFAVLTLLAHQAGRVVTQTQLLRQVWGASHRNDTHYLRIVVSRLRQKLGDDPHTPHLLQTEPGIGYRLHGEPESQETLP
ncbi:response regulator transcription factor [Vreelandella malpeensis]|uniref:Response regulator transcription factor n=1 Tax=Vreelandella malpeensis TaxID=1172368 RepID=A0ABS8DWF4_9GAMM|nr:response regulator transcription factor [Halomonas malpeensis]MCB8890195.1 response regulator transcription factor [Halomonas malpeensis]